MDISKSVLRVVNLNQELLIDKNKSILENLIEQNIPIKYMCNSGICGSCKYRLNRGSVRSIPDFCLSKKDNEDGIYLACCSFPDEDSEIEII